MKILVSECAMTEHECKTKCVMNSRCFFQHFSLLYCMASLKLAFAHTTCLLRTSHAVTSHTANGCYRKHHGSHSRLLYIMHCNVFYYTYHFSNFIQKTWPNYGKLRLIFSHCHLSFCKHLLDIFSNCTALTFCFKIFYMNCSVKLHKKSLNEFLDCN